MSTTPFGFDAIVIGGGPAGLSAALVLGRACRRVLLADAARPRNAVTRAVHGFLTRDGISPAEFRGIARAQLEPYDVTLEDAEAVDVKRVRGGFEVFFDGATSATARRLLLATGMRDVLPTFPGFDAIYGQSAHHCPYCDGWEWRGRRVAVYAPDEPTEYALGLTAWTGDVVLLTDGRPAPKGRDASRLRTHGVRVETREVAALRSTRGLLETVEFVRGEPLRRETLFFHLGMDQASDLPARLRCRLNEDGFVAVNTLGATSVQGVYAAGDLTPGPQSAIMAAAEGATAAAALHQDLRQDETR